LDKQRKHSETGEGKKANEHWGGREKRREKRGGGIAQIQVLKGEVE